MNKQDISTDFFQFLEKNPQIKVLCFDFFDTLIYRTVEPEHTKRLASRQLSLMLNNSVTGQEIYSWRQYLEAKLCRLNQMNGKDPEFDLRDYADGLHDMLVSRPNENVSGIDKAFFRKLVVDIEIHVETRVQRVFSDTQEMLRKSAQRGYKTVIVSDFYIPSPYFQEFLDFHGFSPYIDRVFLSADAGLTKASGRLYPMIVKSLDCSAEEIAMIGDNKHSDIGMAEAEGLTTFYVDRQSQKSLYKRWADTQISMGRRSDILENQIQTIVKKHGGEIFPEFAITLWRFTYLLFKLLMKDGVRNVFFFSKEGEFLKSLFDAFQRDQFGRRIIQTHYVLVSRKSTFICSLKPLMEENFSRIFHQYRDIAPRDFLLSLGFSEQEAEDLCKRLDVDFEMRVVNFGISDTFIAIVGSPVFQQRYERKRSVQKKNFLAYLRSFGVDIEREELNIVDVGWKGSIQDNIFHTLDKKVRISGYYVGLVQPTRVSHFNRKTGVLFSEQPVETLFSEVYNCNRSLFEMLLAASHGSADGYLSDTNGNNLEGEAVDFDHESFVKHDNVYIKTLDLPDERKLFTEQIKPIQECFLKVCREINRFTVVTDTDQPTAQWFARRHGRMMYRPTRREVLFFESLYHLENFGIFEYTDFQSRGKFSIGEKWENLKKVISDPETVLNTGIWAPVVLKRLGVGFYHRWFGTNCQRRIFSHSIKGSNIQRSRRRPKPSENVHVAFLLGIPDINGGTYIVFEHAVRLKRKGYRVYVLTPEKIHPDRYAWHPDAAELEWMTFEEAGDLTFDYAIATWWMSTLYLSRIKADTYLYFIQSIESRFFPSEREAKPEEIAGKRLSEKTYLFPLPIITEARWIQAYLRENYGHEPSIVLNGIRKDIYTEKGESNSQREAGKLRVMVEGPVDVGYKNVNRAIQLSRHSDADEVWLLTASDVNDYPGVDRVFSQIPILDTPSIYRSCDVLLKLSTIEGMFGPPLEMFHCGGTAIVLNVTGHDEYIRHDVNSLVVQMNDAEAVVESLNLLKRQPEVLERLKEGARNTAKQWPGWDESSDLFEKELKQLKDRTWPDRSFLSRNTDRLWQGFEDDLMHFDSKITDEEEKTPKQTCQIFWHYGSGFTETESHKIAYESGDWVRLHTTLSLTSNRCYLRIDPCMKAGMIQIQHIMVSDVRRDRLLMTIDGESKWREIEIGGTAVLIDKASALTIKAFDQDPQIVLEPIDLDHDVSKISVEVSLKTYPFPLTVEKLLEHLGKRGFETTSN